ncbi:hypothetical protein RRF57_004526 [Xylaria bambusicola]|uniref:Fungal N-terminal domain-containing protein n=1 Tax=Xylaria bambusicola TaxID=326684 RepID=A0AAN7UNY7_9PEZI
MVSLGLQVFAALKQYLDDVNSRDERVTKIRRYLEQLKETLDIIDTATQSFQTTHQGPSNVVSSCLVSCKAEMNTLQGKLQEYGPSQQSNAKERMKDFKKRLQYPFQIPVIEEIEKCLERIIDKLLLAIHGLELANVDSLNDAIKHEAAAISKLELDIDANHKLLTTNATQLTDITSSIHPLVPMIQALESNIDTTHKLIDANTTQLTRITSNVNPLASMIESRVLVTRNLFDKFENQVYTNHSITTEQLGVLASHAEASAKATTEILGLLAHINKQLLPTNQEDILKQLVVSLVSKPSLLKDIQASLDLQQEEKPSSITSTSISKQLSPISTRITPNTFKRCNCTSWRSVNEKRTRWRAFYFFSQKTTASIHRPGCPRYASDVPEHEQAVGITYAGLQRLCSAAVSVGLCLRYGAGGASISPMFRYHYVVDEYQSPPFRMVRVLQSAIYEYRSSQSIGPSCELNMERVLKAFLSWITVAYDKQVATPRDVTINGASLIDYLFEKALDLDSWVYPPSLISSLLDFGINATRQKSVFSRFSSFIVSEQKVSYVEAVSLVLRKCPDLWDRYNATDIDFFSHRNAICRSSELSIALEASLDPICIAFFHQDLKRLSQILATGSNSSLTVARGTNIKPLTELVLQWPAGLKYILDTRPDFFNIEELEFIFGYIITRPWVLFSGDSRFTALLIKFRLEHDCLFTEQDFNTILFKILYYVDRRNNFVQVILQHLQVWREKLREALQTYLPQEQSTLNKSEVLDSKASYAVSRLQSMGLDPYKMFGLQRGDYRLGSSGKEPRSIFHSISSPQHAQIAFDLGFRDIDVPSKGITPLCEEIRGRNSGYWIWLIDHGANYTRKLAWTFPLPSQSLHKVDAPQYLVIHWIFRCFGLFYSDFGYHYETTIDGFTGIVTSMARSSWASHLTEANCYDGCSCGCLSDPRGCSPFVVFLNQYLRDHYKRCNFGEVLEYLGSLSTQYTIAVESIIRSLTFWRLDIRHTCCYSIDIRNIYESFPVDYGSDFDELREEDEDRVHQLDSLVTKFVNEYNKSDSSLKDFLSGPWKEEMDRIEAEEKSMRWTAEEESMMLSIGVLPKDGTECTDSPSECETVYESEDDDELYQSDYWIQQFEIIVNGGRSVEERPWWDYH